MIIYSKSQINLLNQAINDFFPHIKPASCKMKITHQGISRMVMLDRYAQKDQELKTLAIGDLVIAKIKPDPKFPTLGIAFVRSILPKHVQIKVDSEYIGQIDPSFKHQNGLIKIHKSEIQKPLEIFYEQIATRVGKALGKGEKPKIIKKFISHIQEKNIVPAGRVLYGAGSGTKVTYFNCFVMPMPKDSRIGIAEHRKEIIEIMSRGGGVGTNGSTLRPKNAVALSVGGKSSGSVSWLNDLANLTNLVQKGGSRRGAQMIMMQDWHPDIIEFIISKIQKPQVLKWISENFDDPLIKKEANNKLQFQPFSDFENAIYKDIVKNTDNNNLFTKVNKLIKSGGEYKVISPEFLSGANISVGITKEFMAAVRKDLDYTFKFPDISALTPEQKAFYDDKWHEIGDVRIWQKKGFPVKEYHTIKARKLWDLINFCATYSAEPGVFFIDRANEMTNATAYDQKVVCTNPCGEQPLAPYSVCNLSAINLANMVDKKTGKVLWNKLEDAINTSIRMQDNIIDSTPYFLEENKIQATGERRIGMGVMGLHDFLIWQGIKYGSKESLKVIDKLFKKIATTAYLKSADLALEKGPFSFMTSVEKLLNTGFIKKMPDKVKKAIIKNKGLRNSHLLTIAPTGTTGTMVGVSTGLEPYFAFNYFRSGRLGKFIEVEQNIVQEYRKIKKLSSKDKLPDIFVSAMDLNPEEHADVQITIQKWIDSSISKTVNAPKGYTVRQVEKIYQRLYEKGAKGGTVYVDGSRDAQVLSISNSENKIQEKIDIKIAKSSENEIKNIKKSSADIPNHKQDRKQGTDVGDVCPICKEGAIQDFGGCHTCVNCSVQLKCGL